jgi:membrane protein DedA with SNARE-associated domain
VIVGILIGVVVGSLFGYLTGRAFGEAAAYNNAAKFMEKELADIQQKDNYRVRG